MVFNPAGSCPTWQVAVAVKGTVGASVRGVHSSLPVYKHLSWRTAQASPLPVKIWTMEEAQVISCDLIIDERAGAVEGCPASSETKVLAFRN